MKTDFKYNKKTALCNECICILPGIAFAHFTAATTCRPPSMLRVDSIRQLESGSVLS